MSVNAFSRREWLIGATAAASQLRAAPSPPPKSEPLEWTIAQAAAALESRSISSEELTKLCLERIHRHDSALNAFITLTEQPALEAARECDRNRARLAAQASPLYGIPIALKDNIDTAGLRTTAASRIFKDRVPREDAEVTRRLKAVGVVLLGKLNLDEFAFEGTGTTSFFGPVHNPWNLQHITGGSSAGSAAAVSARLCFASVGSDDGGSVRIPGAFCGVTGFKTSYGRVSTRGVIPSAYSLDTIGPITRSVEDAALMLEVLAGFDPRDSITPDVPVPRYRAALTAPVDHFRIGVPRDYFFEKLHPAVSSAVEEAINLLRSHVREVRDIRLPRFQFVENGSYNVELLHYQAQFFDKWPELYHPWSRRELSEMKKVVAVNYVETLKRIREARRDIRGIFEQVDLLVLPTMREPAPSLEETINETHVRPPSNVSAFNRFGTPSISVPCGFSKDGLPVGMQIVAPGFAESAAIALAHKYQQWTSWHRQPPPLAA